MRGVGTGVEALLELRCIGPQASVFERSRSKIVRSAPLIKVVQHALFVVAETRCRQRQILSAELSKSWGRVGFAADVDTDLIH